MTATTTWFKELVPIANPSGKEDQVRQYIADHLNALGFSDQIIDDAGNLLVRIAGDSAKDTFLLSAHMDSVPPCEGIEAIEDSTDGRPIIRSAGKTILGADDKSGIAVMLAVAKKLHETPQDDRHPVEFLFSTQEEVGLLGLKAFDITASQAAMGFVLDGEGNIGDIFHAGPTQKSLIFELEGLRSHAGIAPEAGVSAIEMAVHLCGSLPSGRLSPETTMNLGVIQGGDAMNIVAPSTVIRGEARSHDNEALDRLMKQVHEVCQEIQEQFPRGAIRFNPIHKYDGFVVPKDHPAVLRAASACRKLGIEPSILPMNIGSDAHILNHKNIPSVVLGMGFHFSHSLGEFIYVDELEQVTQWVLEIIHSP